MRKKQKEKDRRKEHFKPPTQEHGNIYLSYPCVSYSKEAEEDARFLNTSPQGEYQDNPHPPSNHSNYSSRQSEPGKQK